MKNWNPRVYTANTVTSNHPSVVLQVLRTTDLFLLKQAIPLRGPQAVLYFQASSLSHSFLFHKCHVSDDNPVWQCKPEFYRLTESPSPEFQKVLLTEKFFYEIFTFIF